jgi:hypothetical protein
MAVADGTPTLGRRRFTQCQWLLRWCSRGVCEARLLQDREILVRVLPQRAELLVLVPGAGSIALQYEGARQIHPGQQHVAETDRNRTVNLWVDSPVADHRVTGQIAVVIQHQVQFHRLFAALVQRPVEHGQAQRDGGRVGESLTPRCRSLPSQAANPPVISRRLRAWPNGQNSMATSCVQLLKPPWAWRSALCSWTRASKARREKNCKIRLKMLDTRFMAKSPSDWCLVLAEPKTQTSALQGGRSRGSP